LSAREPATVVAPTTYYHSSRSEPRVKDAIRITPSEAVVIEEATDKIELTEHESRRERVKKLETLAKGAGCPGPHYKRLNREDTATVRTPWGEGRSNRKKSGRK